MNKLLALFLICVFMLSCSKEGEISFTNTIDNSWEKEASQVFNFEINDFQKPKNIIFVIENNNDYPFSNLWIISSLNKKGEKTAKVDTLNYILAKPNGEWIGTGLGSSKTAMFQYKLNHTFPENGSYTIAVKQAMRKDNLQGISKFGIKIEQSQP